MKKQHNLLIITLFALVGLCFVSCRNEKISLSAYELWFPGDVGSVQDIFVESNCAWTISIDDDADWFTIKNLTDPSMIMSGNGDTKLSVTVQPMDERAGRTSSFTITSIKGKTQVKVSILQNTDDLVELTDIRNMAFGVSNVAHWNVNFWGEVIEDSYISKEFNPYDTASGFIMYFFDDGTGIQKDNFNADTAIYYPFTFEYDFEARNLHIDFETWADSLTEIYDAPVLLATENVFRFLHEPKPKSWERADMKKIGTAHKPEAKEFLKRATKKRKVGQGIFQF